MGDTNLAKKTIEHMIKDRSVPEQDIILVPLAEAAVRAITGFLESRIRRILLSDIIEQSDVLTAKRVDAAALKKIELFLQAEKARNIYVGVPSPADDDIAFQVAEVAENLGVTSLVAYEFMFEAPKNHSFWNYLSRLSDAKHTNVAVPLQNAVDHVHAEYPFVKMDIVGHLSIDNALTPNTVDVFSVKRDLNVESNQNYAFISGTTQPMAMDANFVEAILKELATGCHPNMQVRFGIHPGIKQEDEYVKILLSVCDQYPQLATQFKIILTPAFKARLKESPSSPFILEADISGSQAAAASNRVGQAVTGALLNEAALQGKPAYFHEREGAKPYLDEKLFSGSLAEFFTAPRLERQQSEIADSQKTEGKVASLLMR